MIMDLTSPKQRRRAYATVHGSRRPLSQSCDIPPPLWEYEERERGRGRDRERSSLNSASTCTTFEEVDSIFPSPASSVSRSLSRSISQQSGSSSPHLSMEGPGGYDGSHGRNFMNLRHVRADPWKWRRQVSLGGTSATTSGSTNSTSTFDEVESLDFGGSSSSQELSLEYGLAQFTRGLTYEDLHSLSKRLDGPSSPEVEPRRQRRDDQDPKLGDEQSTSDDSSLKSDSSHHKHHKRRTLIEDEEEELPFSSHVFNKPKDKKDKKHDKHKGKHLSVPSESSVEGVGDESSDSVPSKSLFEQLLAYKQRPKRSDSSGSSVSTNFSIEPVQKFPFESEYQFQVRRRTSKSSLAGGTLSRGVSMESTSSSFSSASSPSDPVQQYVQPYPTMPSAEDVLLNLGFCGSESFIPERFARDWYQKTVGSRQDRLAQQQQESMDLESSISTSLSTSTSRSTSGRSTPLRPHSGVTSDKLHRVDATRGRRARFRRSATVVTIHQDGQKSKNTFREQLMKSKEIKDKSVERNERQDSMDALKSVLQKQASLFQQKTDNTIKDKKRKAFAAARQKSLPLWLDTLTEEEEGRLSRAASTDWKSDNMRSFLEEERRLSKESSHDSDSRSDKPSSSRKGSNASSMAPMSSSNECSDQEDTGTGSSLESAVSTTVLFRPPVVTTSQETWMRPPLHSIPSIVVSRLTAQSSSSLEIAEIMDGPKLDPAQQQELEHQLATGISGSGKLQVEPALAYTDILSSDNEESKSAASSRRSSINLGDSLDDRLSLPSVSPVPVSPVTVIEMDHLDNQSDSLDSVDSDGRDLSLESGELAKPTLSLQPISEEEIMSSDQSRNTSFDADSCRTARTSTSSVSGDDGALSPHINKDNSLMPYSRSLSGSKPNSESAYESSDGEDYSISNSSFDIMDAQIQADDGTLSPIIMLPPPPGTELPPGLCWVTDMAVQCDSLQHIQASEQWTQTSIQDDYNWQWSISTVNSEGEPNMHYYISESCQTDTNISCPNCASSAQPNVSIVSRKQTRFSTVPLKETKDGKLKKDYVSAGRKALDGIIERLSRKMEMRAKKIPLLASSVVTNTKRQQQAQQHGSTGGSCDSQTASSNGSFDKVQTHYIQEASRQVLASIDSFDLHTRRLSFVDQSSRTSSPPSPKKIPTTGCNGQAVGNTNVSSRQRGGSLGDAIMTITRNQSTESRRSSLQRQLHLDILSQSNTPSGDDVLPWLQPTPEEPDPDDLDSVFIPEVQEIQDICTAANTAVNRQQTINVNPTSIDKDKLAASIVTDLFQGINTQTPDGDAQLQVLRDIELDYQVLRAVNKTLDRLLSGELTDH